ncbi:hypothetical protein BKA70DRAFT_1437466 [Coprinopsis sp. MPI-PUGE-AT-0042]|nr:hypothetical protein BKA70DRAFT_1437466 [Coprinopsis sp. MPI-PUGE-AT-0042]
MFLVRTSPGGERFAAGINDPMTLLGLGLAAAFPVPHPRAFHSHCQPNGSTLSLPHHRSSASQRMILCVTKRSKRATQLRQS